MKINLFRGTLFVEMVELERWTKYIQLLREGFKKKKLQTWAFGSTSADTYLPSELGRLNRCKGGGVIIEKYFLLLYFMFYTI